MSPSRGGPRTGRDVCLQDDLQRPDEFQQGNTAARSHVDDFARRLRRVARREHARDDVTDEREVARLPAIAVHVRRLAGRKRFDEQRNHARVG